MPEEYAKLFEVAIASGQPVLPRRSSLSRNAASYWSSPRLRSQDPTSMVLHPVLETMIVEIGKGVQQGLLYGFLPRGKPRAVSNVEL